MKFLILWYCRDLANCKDGPAAVSVEMPIVKKLNAGFDYPMPLA